MDTNPDGFSPSGSAPRPRVEVTRGEGPYANAWRAAEAVAPDDLSGARVLVKPNAGRKAPPGSGTNTHPEAVAAVLDLLTERGARCSVGESPIIGVRALESLETSGIAAVARARGIPLLDLDAPDPVVVEIPDGVVVERLKVCREVLAHDRVVSVAVMKTHMHTGASLSLKNMKGCLWRKEKVRLHHLPPCPAFPKEKPLNLAIADMASVLRPALAVIDGYIGMEGLGPSAGPPREANLALASRDCLAADAVACFLMDRPLPEVPCLSLAAARGLGTVDLDRLDIRPAEWRTWRRPFAPPPRDLSLAFPGVTVLDRNACSACQSTLYLFLNRYGDRLSDYFPPGTALTVALGLGHEEVPAGTLCLGNCTARHRERGLFVPGCPPVASEIIQTLRDHAGNAGGEDTEE